MDYYLFKVQLKKKGVPSSYKTSKSKPLYLVEKSKELAERLANDRIKSDLEIVSVSKLAKQLAPHIYSASEI